MCRSSYIATYLSVLVEVNTRDFAKKDSEQDLNLQKERSLAKFTEKHLNLSLMKLQASSLQGY